MLKKALSSLLMIFLASTFLHAQDDQTRSHTTLDTTHKLLKVAIASTILLPLATNLILNALKKAKIIVKPTTQVGIVSIEGVINANNQSLKHIRNFFEDDNVQAVVLKIESAGGAAGSSQAFSYEILRLRAKYPKPLIVFVENIAASGAYYIAATADYIVATPSAMIGSIGSYLEIPILKDFLAKHQISFEYIKSGEHKTAGNPMTHLTENQRQHLQLVNDTIYTQFVQDIYSWRKDDGLDANSDLWAQGKIFSGEQALALHLIDKTGSFGDIEEILAQNYDFTNQIEWLYPPQKSGLLQILFGSPTSIKAACIEIMQAWAHAWKMETTSNSVMHY